MWIGYDSHAIKFDRVAFTPVNVPLLNQSTFSASTSVGKRSSLLTYTLRVRNIGVVESVVTGVRPRFQVMETSEVLTTSEVCLESWTDPGDCDLLTPTPWMTIIHCSDAYINADAARTTTWV